MENEETYGDCSTNPHSADHRGEPERIYDGMGIYLCRVCSFCKAERLRGYRPDIFDNYFDPMDAGESLEEV